MIASGATFSNQTSNITKDIRSVSYGSSLDFRRRVDREFVERVLSRAEPLPDADRELLHMIFASGRTAVDAARLLGMPPRVVRRRLRSLVIRLHTARYLFVSLHLESWSATRRRVAAACFINGWSLSRAASELRLSYHQVRRHRGAIAAQAEAVGA